MLLVSFGTNIQHRITAFLQIFVVFNWQVKLVNLPIDLNGLMLNLRYDAITVNQYDTFVQLEHST